MYFEDVDECAGDSLCLEPNTQCLNTEGTYQCVCKMGFYWSGAGNVCVGNDYIHVNLCAC